MATVEWIGTAGHFIGAHDCCFRLHTLVNGKWRVSTVGCYHREGQKPQEIGFKRKYETMVFEERDGQVTDYIGVDFAGYNDEAAATNGHMAMVAKYMERE